MRARVLEAAVVTGFALLIVTAMTWPLAPKMGHAGRLDPGDGQFSVWNVAWVARTIITDPSHLYNANIFYPRHATLAYSEANLGAGLLAVPFYWASDGNPYLAHNATALLAFVLAFAGAYGLVRHLSGCRTSAAIAGVSFAFCPYVFSHMAHIQLLFTAGLPCSLLAMHRLVDRPSMGRSLVLALALAAQALSCGYYGMFAGSLVGYGIIFYGWSRQRWREPSYWLYAAVAAGLSIAIVVPFFLPYLTLQQHSGFTRTLEDARRWAATWRSYGASSGWGHRWVLPYIKPWGEVLYPGTVAVVFGGLGVLGLRRRDAPPSGRDHIVFYASVAVIAVWCSLGPDAGLYAVLRGFVPWLSWIRAPSRIGVVVVLALAVLAGFTIARLLARTRWGSIAGAILVCATIADLYVGPLRLIEARPQAPAYAALRSLPDGAVVEFPFWSLPFEFWRHSQYMLNSTFHWKPIINGYSDYTPPDWRAMANRLSPFPTLDSFAVLRPIQPRYVVFHINYYNHRDWAEVKARIEQYRDYLRPVILEDPVWLFQIDAWPPTR
jgi:hypothetical protein